MRSNIIRLAIPTGWDCSTREARAGGSTDYRRFRFRLIGLLGFIGFIGLLGFIMLLGFRWLAGFIGLLIFRGLFGFAGLLILRPHSAARLAGLLGFIGLLIFRGLFGFAGLLALRAHSAARPPWLAAEFHLGVGGTARGLDLLPPADPLPAENRNRSNLTTIINTNKATATRIISSIAEFLSRDGICIPSTLMQTASQSFQENERIRSSSLGRNGLS